VIKNLLIIAFPFILVLTLSGQDMEPGSSSRPKNIYYVNLLGDASLISLNYERSFGNSKIFFLSPGIGLGYNQELDLNLFGSGSSNPRSFITVPHHITGNIGSGAHYFEFGFGGTIILGNTNNHYLFYPVLGYKIHPKSNQKLFFKIFTNIAPFFAKSEDASFAVFGLGLGGSF
jgi:hypothetical protein